MKLNVLAAAALAVACLAAPAFAADPPTTALPLGTPAGTVYNEATWFDGTYYWPKPILNGWTGSAAKPLSLDANGNPSVTVLNPLTGFSTATAQSTGNGFLSTVAGAVLNSRFQVDCITGCSGGGGGSGGAVTQSGTWNVGLTGTLPAYAAPPTFNLGTLNGAATAAGQASLLAALGTPLQAGGSVTVTGGPTATAQTAANGSLTNIAANAARPGSGTMATVSTTAVTNGFALPVGVIGTRIYLPTSSESITYTVEPATTCGASAPGPTITVAGPAGIDENLTGQVVCVTAAAGAPRARGY